ncbi:hypothetical protein P389DRAFT_62920 [Cystobasidium minutum MCA 4210]|uniref:uncharacterized protein n=1 Tax=Cystobasidium minutum MCA 4210 TaxID=1397322 RepID=UPI0034CEE270|eukprot:jgi/Rhomi1/62920/CE62919_235
MYCWANASWRSGASLVCTTWNRRARKRLDCIASVHRVEYALKLQRLRESGMFNPHDVRHLAATLHWLNAHEDQKITATMLREIFQNNPSCLRDVHIETQNDQDDPELADFLAGSSNLVELSISHSWGTRPLHDDDDYHLLGTEYDVSSDDSNYYEDYRTDTLATGPPLLQRTLTSLPKLKHLFLERFDVSEAIPEQACPFGLEQLSLEDSRVSSQLLKWLLPPPSRLSGLSLVNPQNVTRDDLFAIFSVHGRHLTTLILAFPWTMLPENLAPYQLPPAPPSTLVGAANEILPLCPKLEVLSLEDSSLDVKTFPCMPSLKELYLNLCRLADYEEIPIPAKLPRLKIFELYIASAERRENLEEFWLAMKGLGIEGHAGASLPARYRLRPDLRWNIPEPTV